MLVDALIRLQLPIEQLRAQTYDGASNMSGKYSGCQVEVKKVQPLAKYVHCGAHITHLVTSKAVQIAPFIKDALDHVHELGKLYDGSGKYKHLYLHLHDDDTEKGKCILGLLASLPIINCLEALNKSLHGSGINVSGMLESVKVVSGELKKLRSIVKFSDIYQAAKAKIAELDLTPLAIPRQRKRPKRLQQGNAEAFTTDTAEQMYRIQFFTAIDTAITNLQDYFVSSDLAKYQELSALLLNGTTSNEDAIIQEYPELTESLKIELSFYRNHHPASTLEGHRLIFKAIEPSVRRMFPQVERLLRLLLVSPASSCEAERSFSALRRIKTWLRSTMTQKRLNHVMVCHVHRDRLGAVDYQQIAEEFIDRCSDSRRKVFGKF
ncbi:uncharacterized protein LOC121385875 [Gigantopelta aegis]|uniref:uncharacterized protein LOC121385875 n=1 Tax=Gigantopelta aegis TaxID=1735272 RepID=UPI001B887F0C|nr:uncharacterized protein LOC121385875 [Gigantopelta aegis]